MVHSKPKTYFVPGTLYQFQDPFFSFLKPFSRLLLTLTCFRRDPNRNSRAIAKKQGNTIRLRTKRQQTAHHHHITTTTQSRRERETFTYRKAHPYTYVSSFLQKAAAFGSGPDCASQRPRAPPRTRAGSCAAGAARAVARFSVLALSEATTRPTRTATKGGQCRWPWRQCR